MPRCSFCKKNYEFPYGLSLILNDGNILYFCSSKCRRNQLKLKRDNKKVNWIRKDPANKQELKDLREARIAEVARVSEEKIKKEKKQIKEEKK